jgi:hypothetical protein
MENNQPTNPKPKLRWLYPTPSRLLVVLLAVEGVLLLSERFQWFAFNEKKGWTVLIAVAAVGLFLLLMLLWLILALLFRWHFQFSIRSLLVLTVVVAIPCSWLAVEMKWAREQKEVVEELDKLPGFATCFVQYDYELDSSDDLIPNAQAPGPAWLRNLLGNDFFANVISVRVSDYPETVLKSFTEFPHLKTLWIRGCRIRGDRLEQIRFFTELKSLCLADVQITDSGLKHLKGLTQLQELYLQNNAITDDGLKYLKDLSQLQLLRLDKTEITDNGLKILKKLSHLQILFLNGTKITDAGLENLKDFAQLRTLGIRQTIITYTAIRDFQKALPNLKIER